MHGRLKVRTTEEKEAAAKKLRDEKVLAYRIGMNRVFAKRQADEYDAEMLSITTHILEKNPDIATLWNMRRECLLREYNLNPLTDLFRKDLEFTVVCLKANPKSYCAWHHRSWCLETSAEPDWVTELELCTKFLNMDERNFHVWDYRRYVAEMAAVPAKIELHFCTQKIEKNFSNYSSWHYRSKLLQRLHPHETDLSRPINESILRRELGLVLKATFTAPNDSSAWFYQRWLLGYSAPALDLAAFKITSTQAIVSFSIPVNLNDARCSLSLDARTKFETSKWHPVGSSTDHSCIWMLKDSFELNDNATAEGGASTFTLEFVDTCGNTHKLSVSMIGDCLFGIKMPKFEYEFEASVRNELQQQLLEFEELSAIEDDSKFTLLTTALMMRAIDRPRYHATTLQHLESLCKLDPMRSGYYTDLSNKWSVEQVLQQWISSGTYADTVDLSATDLVTLSYDQYLCVADRIDLGKSSLRRESERKLVDIYAACGVTIVRDGK